MEIKEISTMLWAPRNKNPSFLERQAKKKIEEKSNLPKQTNNSPIYLPVEKLRKLYNGINILI